MNRFGVDSLKQVLNICKIFKKINYLGAYTHLFSNQIQTSLNQIDNFLSISPFNFNHITFKEGVEYKGLQKISAVRSGINVLGAIKNRLGLKQAFEIYGKVIKIRSLSKGQNAGYDYGFVADSDCLVAIVNFGYSDMAIKRAQGWKVCIKGRLYEVKFVAMDVLFVVVDKEVNIGDKVIISGDFAPISINRLANYLGTIPYEITCSYKDK